MDVVKGSVVRVLAGRDKHKFFVVVGVEERWVSLCDGKGRRLENPKRKNIIHIAPTAAVLTEQQMTTNRSIRNELLSFCI